MSNLVPEVRVNKNGVPVLKHVRPSVWDGAGVWAPSIPAPRREDFVLSNTRPPIMDIIRVIFDDWSESDAVKNSILETLDPDTAAVIDSSAIPVEIFGRTVKTCVATESFELLNNMAVLSQSVTSPLTNDFDQHCDGLRWYKHLKMNLDLSTEESRVAATALVQSAMTLPSMYRKKHAVLGKRVMEAYTIASPHLSRLIAENPEESGRIVALLSDRLLSVEDSEDVADLISVLKSSATSSLSDGVL